MFNSYKYIREISELIWTQHCARNLWECGALSLLVSILGFIPKCLLLVSVKVRYWKLSSDQEQHLCSYTLSIRWIGIEVKHIGWNFWSWEEPANCLCPARFNWRSSRAVEPHCPLLSAFPLRPGKEWISFSHHCRLLQGGEIGSSGHPDIQSNFSACLRAQIISSPGWSKFSASICKQPGTSELTIISPLLKYP